MKPLALLFLLTATQEVPLFELHPRQPEPPQISQCLNINMASKAELLARGGVTPEIADTIIRGRPYKTVGDVESGIPKEVRDKNRTKFCLWTIQIISGNKSEKLRFEAEPKFEATPKEGIPPAEQPLPKETVEERFRKLLEEAGKVK